MFYKISCSELFKEQLNEIFEYVTVNLKSFIGWQTIKRYIILAATEEDEPERNRYSQDIRKDNNSIKRMTIDKYTIFYQVNYNQKEIYLLYLLYRKN